MNFITKQKQTPRQKVHLWLSRGRVRERERLGVWDGHVHTAIFKINNQKRPTVYSTGNSTKYSVIT